MLIVWGIRIVLLILPIVAGALMGPIGGMLVGVVVWAFLGGMNMLDASFKHGNVSSRKNIGLFFGPVAAGIALGFIGSLLTWQGGAT